MVEVVAPVFHNNAPVVLMAVRVELPQLFTSSTIGVDGVFLGAATPIPLALHPSPAVVVTV